MNERIRELAERAGGNPNYKAFRGYFLPPPPDYIDPATVDLAKFAELIVRECAKKGFDIFDEEPDAPASDLQFYVRDRIKEHFGVEE